MIWRYDRATREFGLIGGGRRIDVRNLRSSEAVLDYIVQQSRRPGVFSDAEIGMLVRALDRLLDLQGNYCSCGMRGDAGKTVRDVLELIETKRKT